MHPNHAIQVKNVSKRYRGALTKKLALDHVSFEVPRGEVFGFLGPNGAGKTTLIKIIVGIMAADSGMCKIYDHMGHGFDSSTRKAKLKLGYLPERPYFHDFLTAEEFLRFHGRLVGMPSELVDSRIPGLLEKVGLSQSRNQRLRTFSKGMLQRVGFAQALIHDPEVLVLDEPMSGLDPVGRREVRDIISEISKTGKTIFFSTHIIHDVEVICTTVGFINKGKLQGSGSIDALLGKTVKSMEVRFALPEKIEPQNIDELKASRKTMDGWVIDIEADAEKLEACVNEVLAEVIKKKGVIKAVTPRKSTLEDLFFSGSQQR